MWLKRMAILILLVIPLSAQVSVSGLATDQNRIPVAGAKIRIEPNNPALGQETKTNQDGVFTLTSELAGGEYFISVYSDGFQEIKHEPIFLINGPNKIEVMLAPIERLTIEVRPEESKVSVEHMPLSETLEDRQIDSIAVPKMNRLINIIASLPGITTDAKGNLHLFGSSSDHTNWLLDGFRIYDPTSGTLEMRLSTEAPRSLDLFASRYSVDLGRGPVTMLINSGMGENKKKRQITNFIPAIELNKGLTISSFDPRLTHSGPIKQDRAWYFNTLNFNYTQNIIPELPKGQDRIWSIEGNNLSRVQINIAPNNVLTAGFLTNYYSAPKSGLNALDPFETTLDRRARRNFANIQDQIFTSGNIVTLGYAWYQSFKREIPQGQEIFQLRPASRSGNATTDITDQTNRHQFLASISFRNITLGGQSHQLKTGLDINRSEICRDTKRTGYQHYRLDGTPTTRVTFGGNGKFCSSMLDGATYLQNRWTINPWFMIEGGLRFDKDGILPDGIATPRVSLTMMPPWLSKTKFSGGFGLMPSPTHLGLFTRKLDQYSINTHFDQNGQIRSSPDLTFFVSNERRLHIGKTSNLSFSLERDLLAGIYARFNYLRKRSRDGLTFSFSNDLDLLPPREQLPPLPIGTIFNLSNSRIETYDSFSIIIEKQFRQPPSKRLRQDNLFFSYTRSRSRSNSSINPFIDDPIIFTDTAGPTPWDIPNQFKVRGTTQIGQKNIFSYFAEWRDGFPYSLNDDEGMQVGRFNGYRIPRYFSLNIHWERKVTNIVWLLVGMDNILDRPNYSQANANIYAPGLPFYGVEPRKLVFRIRIKK